VVVAVEIQDSQPVTTAFGSDAVAVTVGDADAKHAVGTAVLEAKVSLKTGRTSQR
jgi:hypothetical protein